MMDEFVAVARDSAEAFREGQINDGSAGVVALIDAMPTLLRSVSEEEVTQLNETFSEMLDAQERQDYPALADLLDGQLLAILGANQ
jgi:hypothetical protein